MCTMVPKKGASEPLFEQASIIGAGTMGYGIGLYYALHGMSVTLFDADSDMLAAAQSHIEETLTTFVNAKTITEDQKSAVQSRIQYSESLANCVADSEFITEAVTEDLAIKQAVFEELSIHAADDAILTTNTSGLSITEIASRVDNPDRVVGTHWFNPPYIVPLVEVVKGDQTQGEIADKVYSHLEMVEKTPVMVEKDIPGFIGNRIQMAMTYEAFSLLDKGIASPEAIDRAVKAGFGFRLPILGIFEKVDQSGLDVHYDVEEYLMPDLDRGTDPNPVVSDLVEKGHYGLKTGKGVYDWDDLNTDEIYEQRDQRLLELLEVYTA